MKARRTLLLDYTHVDMFGSANEGNNIAKLHELSKIFTVPLHFAYKLSLYVNFWSIVDFIW